MKNLLLELVAERMQRIGKLLSIIGVVPAIMIGMFLTMTAPDGEIELTLRHLDLPLRMKVREGINLSMNIATAGFIMGILGALADLLRKR